MLYSTKGFFESILYIEFFFCEYVLFVGETMYCFQVMCVHNGKDVFSAISEG